MYLTLVDIMYVSLCQYKDLFILSKLTSYHFFLVCLILVSELIYLIYFLMVDIFFINLEEIINKSSNILLTKLLYN